MKKEAKPSRFELVHREWAGSIGIELLRDKLTGILYLHTHYGTAGGLTPLLDSEGRPTTDFGQSAE